MQHKEQAAQEQAAQRLRYWAIHTGTMHYCRETSVNASEEEPAWLS